MLLSFLTLTLSCKKETGAEFTDSPVLEAYLKPGNLLDVKISRQLPFSSDATYSSDDINNLSVAVVCNSISYPLTAMGNGEYKSSSLTVTEGTRYDLSFTFNSKTVKAYTTIPSKPVNYAQSVTEIYLERQDTSSGPPNMSNMPDPVKLTWDNPDGSYYIVVIENIETTLDPIRDFGNATPPGNLFRKPPTTSSGIEINAREFQYFGRHRLILYHVLPDYASLYDQGSTSSQNLTNPSTSITNGYGIFTGMHADTLMLNVLEQ